MKPRIKIFAGAFLSFIMISAQAQNNYKVLSVEASIAGSSTLHDWESSITKIECTGTFEVSGNTFKTIKNVLVKIPVTGIKSKEGKIMDDKTYEAFKYEENPYITYQIKNVEILNFKEGATVIKATGDLTMAGTTKSVEIEGNVSPMPFEHIKVDVTKKLKMTDFGMKPPTAVLGTIKVGDEVTVKASLVFSTDDSLTQSK